MPAYLTTKCPECSGVTGHALDYGLSGDRVELDGKRCKKCIKASRYIRQGKPNHATGGLTSVQMSKKGFARLFSSYAGNCGIR